MNVNCLKCKGRGHCGRKYCPHILKSRAMFKVKDRLSSSDFASSSPAPFVGSYGYPNLNVGILALPEQRKDAWLYDAPRHWAGESFSIPDIVDLRSSLVNSRFRANVRKTTKLLEISQEVGMASKPVDVDISLEDKPKFRLQTDNQLAPHGPKANLKKAEVASNPKIDRKVDKVVSDTDLKAADAIHYLYDHKYDENFLTQVLSVGNLGIKKDRKLVPSRWSITTMDDTLAKHIHKEILDFMELDEHQAYFGGYLGNYYLVMMVPSVWGYELFESYMPKASWNTEAKVNYTTDHEYHMGRKTYADNCAGGYYSVRLAVLEKLRIMKRQAGCLVIRIITGEYSAPLGVWVTREAARKALAEKPLRFSSLDLMQKYAAAICRKKFGMDSEVMIKRSHLLKYMKSQTRLDFFD